MAITPAADPIEAVAARMEAIAAPLPADDGVARFNELYLAVTRAVMVETKAASYEDPAFISRLDVVFADLYFEAIAADAQGRELPKAWAPLFEKRHAHGIAPLQFAIAGMNAHINHDLAVALVQVCGEHGIEFGHHTPQYRDYLVVNKTLERVEGEIKARYTTGVIGALDKAASGATSASPAAACSCAPRCSFACASVRAHRSLSSGPWARGRSCATVPRRMVHRYTRAPRTPMKDGYGECRGLSDGYPPPRDRSST
jgi:hypothetical protein